MSPAKKSSDSLTACPPEVLGLVEKFERHVDAYKKGQYNETQLRREFVDPLFEALGWDIANKDGLAEAYKDVVHEDAIKIEQSVKAPDYCFRVGGTRKFFLETKKPSVYIKEEVPPAFQLRRYAWSAKLPLSILSDFEEFAVYDTRIKPEKTDKASTARVQYLTFREYPEKWGEIASVFSKEAVLKGSFDKYAETARLKKGTATVDDAFLGEIESWRDLLARNIALRNPSLTQRELNFAVQRTIDRIVFLRICEDRGIEEYGRVQSLQNGANVYKRLVQLFSQADDRYNSGLFHFQKEKDRHEEPDRLTPDLALDDKPLKDIIKRLYYPESPYEFSVLSADILGQVYEQFLGKVIRLTPGHQAKVEEKPEVRKAGGVYYTPTYIVDYIVKNTVGKLLGDGSQGSGIGRPGLTDPRNPSADPRAGGAHENTDVQGSGSLAGGDESHGRDISFNKDVSAGRALRIDRPDAEGGSLDTSQYSGGAQQKIAKGVSSSRFDSPGFAGGIGDAPPLGQSIGVSLAAGTGHGVGNSSAGGTTDKRSASLSPAPDRRPLTPKQVSRLKILDPACGSGSFLLGAYQYLLDWHRDWYVSDDPKKWSTGKNPTLYQAQGGDYHLTTAEKKRILLNNIYGVDIDSQAVEVTKLSLLLKVLEGENNQTLAHQLRMFHERALPDLADNIKCGNSLIGPDFYQQQTFLDDEERLRINVFDWEKEFPEIMTTGGFDAVIGNPPYGAMFSEEEKKYLGNSYISIVGKYDSYGFFIERGTKLLRKNGVMGFITPHTWLTVIEAERLRTFLLKETTVTSLVRLPTRVFRHATVNTILMFLKRGHQDMNVVQVLILPRDENLVEIVDGLGEVRQYSMADWAKNDAQMFNIEVTSGEQSLIDKIRKEFAPFTDVCDFSVGIQAYDSHTGQDQRIIESRAYHAETKKDKTYRRELNGNDVSRYYLEWTKGSWISYGAWLAHPRQPHFFEGPRILVREITGSGRHAIHATYTDGDYINYKTILNVLVKQSKRDEGYHEYFVLGILNSSLISWYFPRASNKLVTKTFPRISILDIKRFALPRIDLTKKGDKALHDKIVSLVDQMLSLNKQLPAARTDHEKTTLQRQIDATDRQIDQLVYELYGLTEEDRRIVEGADR